MWEAEVGGCEFKASLGYIEEMSLKKTAGCGVVVYTIIPVALDAQIRGSQFRPAQAKS
jgi:hypothetical protein